MIVMKEYQLAQPVIAEPWSANHPAAVQMWIDSNTGHVICHVQGETLHAKHVNFAHRHPDREAQIGSAVLHNAGSWRVPADTDYVVGTQLPNNDTIWTIMSKSRFENKYAEVQK